MKRAIQTNSPHQKIVLISGTTSGIGLETARYYASQGWRVLALGRRPYIEVPLGFCDAHDYCAIDFIMENIEEALEIVVQWLDFINISKIDVVIHNAGTAYYGNFMIQSKESVEKILACNFYIPLLLTHTLFPFLNCASSRKKNKAGELIRSYVLFVGSIAARFFNPHYSVYNLTKYGLHSVIRNLATELKQIIDIGIIHPGATYTPLFRKIGFSPQTHTAQSQTENQPSMQNFMAPEKVAHAIKRAADKRKKYMVVGFLNSILFRAAYFLGNRIQKHLQLRTIETSVEPPPLMQLRERLAMQNDTSKTGWVVIIGAAQGIGAAITEELVISDAPILLVDRDESNLNLTASKIKENYKKVEIYVVDLLDKKQLKNLCKKISSILIQKIIITAGISAVGQFNILPRDSLREVLDINLYAPLMILHAIVSSQSLLPFGTIVLFSSLSVFIGYPGAAVYSGTKAALACFASMLNITLAPQAIKVLIVYPGVTNTAHASHYSPNKQKKQRGLSPFYVARAVIRGLTQRNIHLIPGFIFRLLAFAGRVCPPLTHLLMYHAIFKKLNNNIFTDKNKY